jgi:hypothetical protein
MSHSRRSATFQQESAELLGLDALTWLMGQDAAARRFLALSGLDPAALAAGAGRPETLAAVLDFLMQDEGLARGFATAHGLAPERLHAARARLAGGDPPHWT